MSTHIQIKIRLAALATEQKHLNDQIQPLRDRLKANYEEAQALREQRNAERLAAGEIDWPAAIRRHATGDDTSAMSRAIGLELGKRFSMNAEGYWGDTRDAAFQVKVLEGDPDSARMNVEGIVFLTPMLKPHADGFVWFGIFEYTLSEHGIYRLKVSPDLSDAMIIRATGSYEREVARFTCSSPGSAVVQAVEYIAQHHSYR